MEGDKRQIKTSSQTAFQKGSLWMLFATTGIFLLMIMLMLVGKREDTGSKEALAAERLDTQEQSEKPAETQVQTVIRSPLNGVELTEEQYLTLQQHIPHAVMISNNESARVEQYGLSFADIVYEAQVEGGITRFMGVYWTRQDDFMIKPVRSVRKYYFDWATEYGNIPVTFTGFATTDTYDTNSYGFAREQGIHVTYYDWPFVKDTECAAILPAMHCKYTTPQILFNVFDKHGWTYDSWTGMNSQNTWQFDDELMLRPSYEKATSVTYDFAWTNEWTSRWEYDMLSGVYKKYDHEKEHIDNGTGKQISASTLIIQKLNRTYTYDSEGHIAYETVGQGDVIVFRDGYSITGVWEKTCYTCRTKYYSVSEAGRGDEIALKPGLIWIAAVPKDAKTVFSNQ